MLFFLLEGNRAHSRPSLHLVALSTPRSHKVIAYVPIGGPERLANARLIAEAPRMLELLTTALDLMSRDEYDSFFGQEIRDLLRDVAGEEE